MIKFLINYWKPIALSFSAISLFITIIKLIINSATINKIQNNEIKHIVADIKSLKTEEKEFKQDIFNKIDKIFRRLGKIDKATAIQKAICDERHGLKKKDK